MLRILVIDEGAPGHISQSLGLAKSLAGRIGAEVITHESRLKLRGFLRPLLKVLFNLNGNKLPVWLMRLVYENTANLDHIEADIVVASGGKALFLAAWLARKRGSPLIYCGDPRPLPPSWCDIILSPVPVAGHPRVIETELLISHFSPDSIKDRGAEFRAQRIGSGGKQIGVLLIGGNSRSHEYQTQDWLQLAEAVNTLGGKGWRWLITTSNRTSTEQEALLRAHLDQQYILKSVWWQQQPEKLMADYLGAADAVFVTQDSLTMLSEAIAAGKPTFALAPALVRHSDLLEPVLTRLQEKKRLQRCKISALQTVSLRSDQFDLLQTAVADEYAAATELLLNDWTQQP